MTFDEMDLKKKDRLLIGKRLRLARSLQNLHCNELAQQTSIDVTVINDYEKGRVQISYSKIFRLSIALHVPMDYIFQDLKSDKVH